MRSPIEQFASLRRSDPAAAYTALINQVSDTIKSDPQTAEAFASFRRNFNGEIFTSEDGKRFSDLRKRGADRLGIKVGSLPLTMSAGLASMYDQALEVLRSSDRPIEPRMFGPRGIRTIASQIDFALKQIGSMGVTALEKALSDNNFAELLRQRGRELGPITLALYDQIGPCEDCTITTQTLDGIETRCGTKEECDSFGLITIILIIILIVGWIISLF